MKPLPPVPKHNRRNARRPIRHPSKVRGIRQRIGDVFGWKCCYCGRALWETHRQPKQPGKNRATLEHLIPIRDGGTTCETNCALACPRCNARAATARQLLGAEAWAAKQAPLLARARTFMERWAHPLTWGEEIEIGSAGEDVPAVLRETSCVDINSDPDLVKGANPLFPGK